MKKQRKSKFFKRSCRAPSSAWYLRQAPRSNADFGRTTAHPKASIQKRATTAVRLPDGFAPEASLLAAPTSVRGAAACLPYSVKTRHRLRLERAERLAMRMAAYRWLDQVDPPSGMAEVTASRGDSNDAPDTERAMRAQETRSAVHADREEVSGGLHTLERSAPLSDEDYNAGLMRHAEHGQYLPAIFVLAGAVGRMSEPCTIRALLDRAGLRDADFMAAVWMIGAGRLVVLSPGRLSLLTFVKPAGPRRAPPVPAPRPLAPCQWGARA